MFVGEDKVEKLMQQVMVHTQAKFCHSSLGVRIHLKQLSIERNKGVRYNEPKAPCKIPACTINQIKNEKLNSAQEKSLNGGLFVGYLGNQWKVEGWAQAGAACTKMGGWAIVYWIWNPPLTAKIMVHEIAHHIGIAHEEASHHKGKDCSARPLLSDKEVHGVPGGLQTWNQCNRDDFEEFYQRHKSNWCMEEKEDACCVKEEVESGYEYLGCFTEDPDDRLISKLMRESLSTVTIKDCFREAINSAPGKGKAIFAAHDNQCYTTDKTTNYDDKGKSKACQCKKGVKGAVSVFKVNKAKPEFDDVGCWKDGSERGLPTLLSDNAHMTPTQC